MNRFLTYKEAENYYILSKTPPHYQGRIVTSPTETVAKLISVSMPGGYNMWIVFAGTITGNKVELFRTDWNKHLRIEFEQMAEWFYLTYILPNPGKYKRFAPKSQLQ